MYCCSFKGMDASDWGLSTLTIIVPLQRCRSLLNSGQETMCAHHRHLEYVYARYLYIFKAHPSFLSSNWTVVYIGCCVWKVPHLWSFLLHRNRTPVWLLVSFLSTFKQALLAFGGFWNRKRSLNARADKQVAWFCHPHPRLQKLSSFIHGEKREGVGVIWH